MTTWFFMRECQESGFKGHVGPTDIMSKLSDSLFRRGMIRQDLEAGPMINSFFLDIGGGFIIANAHKSEVEIEGLTLRFYTQELGLILSRLEHCPEREDIGGGHVYHKFHGRFNCLCLLPAQYAKLVAALREMEPLARAVEAAERKEMVERLSGAPHVKAPDYDDIPEVAEA